MDKNQKGNAPPKRSCNNEIPTATASVPSTNTALTTEKMDQLTFTQAIVDKLPLTSFKVPKFNIYDLKNDAPTHVRQFRSVVNLYGLSEAMMC